MPGLSQSSPGEHATDVVFPRLGEESIDHGAEGGEAWRSEQWLKRNEQCGETCGKITAKEHWCFRLLCGVGLYYHQCSSVVCGHARPRHMYGSPPCNRPTSLR